MHLQVKQNGKVSNRKRIDRKSLNQFNFFYDHGSDERRRICVFFYNFQSILAMIMKCRGEKYVHKCLLSLEQLINCGAV